ncbi:MAG: insulinase family protein [Actinobacteria bacterium]|nr:MAG: insulinase family protein [Actinomycetota bacterium]
MSPRSQVVLRDPGGITVHRTAIPSGPQVFTELIPAVRSVSVGVWVPIGSRHETPATAGATHFLEHLLFKGTPRRSALDIAADIEGLGGEINAFTTKEYTCYHVRLLDEHLDVAIDVLADMLGSSLLRTSDIDAERGVVLEEIAMSEDDPLDLGRTELERELFGTHPLAAPVAGTAHSVSTMRTSALRGHYRRYYTPDNYVVTVVGNASHRKVVSSVTRAFGLAESPVRAPKVSKPPQAPRSRRARVGKAFEQVNLLRAHGGPARGDDRRYAMAVLHTILGGGMSSRLFQEVRERRSLAYSVNAFRATYSDAGVFGVHAGCAPEKLDQTREVIEAVLREVASAGLSSDEVEAAKNQVKGQIVLDLEDPGMRLMRLGTRALFGEKIIGLNEGLERIEAVATDQVCDLAEEVLTSPAVEVVVGPSEESA